MVAFNFNPTFANDIIVGTKRSTIRKTLRCNVGDNMQLYTGQRTKSCRKLLDATCIGIAKIKVTKRNIWKTSDGKGRYLVNPALHEQEGFKNVLSFVLFFENHYGLPFTGYLHTWEPNANS